MWVRWPTVAIYHRSIRYSLKVGCPFHSGMQYVTPLLKKPGLDAENMSSYWPVSSLGFMYKVVEQSVAIRLNDYLVADDLLQSAYRKKIRPKRRCYVCGHTFLTADDMQNTVDYDLPLQRLQFSCGLVGIVLEWIHSRAAEGSKKRGGTEKRRPKGRSLRPKGPRRGVGFLESGAASPLPSARGSGARS